MAQSGYTPIQLYHSTTAGNAPTAADLLPGELAINIADGIIYYEDDLGVVQQFTSGGGGGGGGGTSVTVTQATATASQTTFNVTYTVGQLSVYLNGALLASADYTATNGTTVVLAAGAAANDIFTAVAYSTVAGLEIDSASPYLTAVGSGAGAVTTGVNNVFVGFEAGNDNSTGTNNVALGYRALDANTTGFQNVAVGASSMTTSTTASYNTAAGYWALEQLTTGSYNTAFGWGTLDNITTGANNTAVGYGALYSSTASNNTAVGHQALNLNSTGANNTGIGYQALGSNTTGTEHVAVGYGALDANTTASGSTAIGFNALTTNTTGVRNTAVGAYALLSNSTGAENTAMGANAGNSWAPLMTNTTGTRNTAFGAGALAKNTTADDNTAVGHNALLDNTTGIQNTAVGKDAGDVIQTGNQNICIGYATDPGASNGLGQITIGYGLAGQGNYHVTMGTNSSKIYVNYTSTGTWTQTSDATLKNVIGNDSLGLSFINRLNPVTFTWKAQNELPVDHPHYSETNKKNTTTVMHGLLAQDVKAAMDAEGCSTFNGWDEGPDGIQAVSREMFVTPLIKAIQELSAKCDALQAEIDTLKGQ